MKNKKEILSAFNTEEDKILFSKVLDVALIAEKTGIPKFTDFIDPKRNEIFLNILNRNLDMKVMAFGGAEGLERKILGFFPEGSEILKETFPISAIKITGNLKFDSLPSHRDFLGSVLGLGIERRTVGDIVINPKYTVLFVLSSICDYITANLEKVGRIKVSAKVVDLADIEIPEKKIIEKYRTLSSLRLDSFLSTAFNISRNEAKVLILKDFVSVNWQKKTSLTYTVSLEDIVSVKGYGRASLLNIKGETKKGRIGVLIGVYV